MFDSTNVPMNLYPETIKILKRLKNEGYQLAVDSRTDQPTWAKELMELLEIDRYFDYKKYIPASIRAQIPNRL